MIRSKRLASILGITGFLLSPIMWWDDLLLNIPISWVLASFISSGPARLVLGINYVPVQYVFSASFILAYYMSNIVGILLLKKAYTTWRGKELTLMQSWRINIAICTVYTILIALFIHLDWLKPISVPSIL
jgi:hypothetical protein